MKVAFASGKYDLIGVVLPADCSSMSIQSTMKVSNIYHGPERPDQKEV